ncbi:MAG: class I SAM-dependent methyltransferase [Pseudomonadota bacterium]
MFKQAKGFPYARFLKRLHHAATVDWYLEIGCRKGGSLANVTGKSIAVDPFFKIQTNILRSKPALLLFQQTSDDFFASGMLRAMGARLSLSFIDGMHLMEFALRDFINVERNAVPGGVAMFHDCCPWNLEMTTRDLDNLPKGAWTGDVWKIIPILKSHRPDLTVRVVDASPSGVVVVEGLDPENATLAEAYDDILAEYRDLELADYGVERFNDQFDYESAIGLVRAGFPFLPDSLKVDRGEAPAFVTP